MSNVFSNPLIDLIGAFTLVIFNLFVLKFFSPKKDYQNDDSISRLGNKGLFKPLLTANAIKGMVQGWVRGIYRQGTQEVAAATKTIFSK